MKEMVMQIKDGEYRREERKREREIIREGDKILLLVVEKRVGEREKEKEERKKDKKRTLEKKKRAPRGDVKNVLL